MNRRLAVFRIVLLVLLVVAAVAVFAQAGQAFHDNCKDNEGECNNSPTVYICIQDGSCRFGEEKAVCPPVGAPPVLPHCDPRSS